MGFFSGRKKGMTTTAEKTADTSQPVKAGGAQGHSGSATATGNPAGATSAKVHSGTAGATLTEGPAGSIAKKEDRAMSAPGKPMDAGAEAAAGEKAVARPVLAHDKRRALGRGLESLLPGPRPVMGAAGIGSTGSPAGIAGGASGAAVAAGAVASGAGVPVAGVTGVAGGVANVTAGAVVAAAGAALASVAPASGAGVPGDGAPVPGVIAELQGQAARRQVDGHEVIDIAIELIDKNPHQTRRFMDDAMEALMELADSIKVQGVLQPVTVRPGKEGRYILIAGERRLRASKLAGKTKIPAIVRVVSEQQAAELTIIENLQREDLNCMELALAYALLSKQFNLTQEQIGERVGVARETVSNYMRLGRLPDSVQRHLAMRRLEFSHARVLLNLQDADVIAKVADRAERENWSVDQLEKFVLFDPSMKDVKKNVPKASGGARWVDPNVRAAQRDLERILGLRVRIRDRNGKGKITMEYSTLEDFDRVVGMLKGKG